MVDGRLHHFSAGGLYNGLVLLIDDETRTYWDHITGEAVHGPLQGAQLASWTTAITTVAAALGKNPELTVSIARPSWEKRLAGYAMRFIQSVIRFPPGFRRTMGEVDDRLPEWTRGLGVVVDKKARFYPVSALGDGIVDAWTERELKLGLGPIDRVPFAEWENGERPLQMFSRWYGFSATFPGCQIHGDQDGA